MKTYQNAEKIIEFTKDSIYFGSNPTIPYSAIINPIMATNYQIDPYLHGKFQNAFFFDEPINYYNGWKIIIDEMVHALGQQGHLIFRYCNSKANEIEGFMCQNPMFEASVIEKCKERKYKNVFTIFKIIKKPQEFTVKYHIPSGYKQVGEVKPIYPITVLNFYNKNGSLGITNSHLIPVGDLPFVSTVSLPSSNLSELVKLGFVPRIAYLPICNFNDVFVQSKECKKMSNFKINWFKFKNKL
jgi:hypothetical protein